MDAIRRMKSPGKQRPPCIGCKDPQEAVSVTVRIGRRGFTVSSAVIPLCPKCIADKKNIGHFFMAAQQAVIKLNGGDLGVLPEL